MKIRWTLRDMFLLAFIVALIVPYFINWIPNELNPLTGFSISEAELESWLQEVDPTADVSMGHHRPKYDAWALVADDSYLVQMDNTSPEQLFAQLYNRINEKMLKGNWNSKESNGASERSFSFYFSNGFSHHRIYVWEVPPVGGDDREYPDNTGKKRMRIKVLHLWFNSR